jgi:probable F420-dependent oxidoreductase
LSHSHGRNPGPSPPDAGADEDDRGVAADQRFKAGAEEAAPGLERISIVALGATAADLAEQARDAEAAGIDCIWAPELFRSSVTQAAWIVAATERIGVGTGIAWAFTRSAFILAVSALDLDEMSGGRFRLGLGAGVKRLNETWHGVDYGRPAPHLRETVEAVREIMAKAHAGEPIRYEGDYQDLDIKGWVRPHPPARERIPIYAAAVQEGMARMAGDVADGLIGHPMCSTRWLEDVILANVETGLARSGRERRDFDLIPTVCCAIDDDEQAAYEAARRTVCFYATVRTYAPLWEMHGFGDAAAEVVDASRRGDLAAMPAAVPDEMVDTYCAAGPLDKVRARVGEVAERGDGVFLTPPTYFIDPAQLAGYQRRIVEAFAPAG